MREAVKWEGIIFIFNMALGSGSIVLYHNLPSFEPRQTSNKRGEQFLFFYTWMLRFLSLPLFALSKSSLERYQLKFNFFIFLNYFDTLILDKKNKI
jgi:hypothetical protein